ALRWLAAPHAWPQGRLVLCGPTGTGKTHLLHVMAQRHGWTLLQGPALRGWPAIPRLGAAVDEADLPGEEAALLHLMNACAEARLPLLLAAPAPPARWRIHLPDLRSRLAATAVAALAEPSDALLEALLAKHLAERQLVLDPAVAALLRLRLPRRAGVLAEAVARLDRASLAAGRLNRGIALAAIAPLLEDDDTVTEAPSPLPPGPALL
ncbi:MAG TPA: chromosomal replication initiator DnaA, partial [Roseococcus sp.]|nr:chromosomal replication initiator DnaA [Roseococcus sp.]